MQNKHFEAIILTIACFVPIFYCETYFFFIFAKCNIHKT